MYLSEIARDGVPGWTGAGGRTCRKVFPVTSSLFYYPGDHANLAHSAKECGEILRQRWYVRHSSQFLRR